MQVKILKIEHGVLVDAKINEQKANLPSLHDGWRFNFEKHAKTKNSTTFVLVTEEAPEIIEGCLIYKMLNDEEPYMAYIEIAPHNKGQNKKFDLVAGCLIAFACRLSFTYGKDHFKGWLAFDVQEENKEDEKKLMLLYSKKYKAQRIENTTTMIISPTNGEALIEKYLPL